MSPGRIRRKSLIRRESIGRNWIGAAPRRHGAGGLNKRARALTYDPVPQIAAAQPEDVLLVAVVREVVGLDLRGELLDEGRGVARLGVGVGVPGLLLDHQRGLGQEALEPAGQVAAHVVDLVGVLAAAARPVRVGLVHDYLDAAARALALLPRLFLERGWSFYSGGLVWLSTGCFDVRGGSDDLIF